MGRLSEFAALGVFTCGWLLASGPDVSGCPVEAGSKVVTVPVRVFTEKFGATDNLQAANFEVSRDRVSRKICGVTHVRQPSSIGILLDTSGSMGNDNRTPPSPNPAVIETAAADGLLSAAGPADEFFVELVNNRPEMLCPFTSDMQRLRTGVTVPGKGRTALTDAIYVGLSEMRQARSVNRALVIVSDGEDNASTHKVRDLVQVVNALGVSLFFLTPRYPRQPSVYSPAESEVRNSIDLFGIAEPSGGYVFHVANKTQAAAIARQLPAVIATPYQVYYYEPIGAQRGNLSVKVNGVRPKPIVLYPKLEVPQ